MTRERSPKLATVLPKSDPPKPPESAPARTELGRQLRALRERIVASGQPLLSVEELDREVASRRGEQTPDN
jgi:hypothetical protein